MPEKSRYNDFRQLRILSILAEKEEMIMRRTLSLTLALMLLIGLVPQSNPMIYIGKAVAAEVEDQSSGMPASLITTFVDSPKTSRAFTWYTDDSVVESIVQAVPVSDYAPGDDSVFYGESAMEAYGQCDPLVIDASGATRNIHKVNLTGLQPGTTYFYRVGGNGYFSEVFSFTTESEQGESFTFFNMTDTQAYNDKDYSTYRNYANVLANAVRNYPEGAFVIHSGDAVINNNLEHYDYLYQLISPYSATLAMMITPGNHELQKDTMSFVKGLDNLRTHYQFPENGPEGAEGTVYSFDYGNAHIVILDSNQTVNYSAQIAWLKKDMQSSDKQWKILSIHTGPYNNYGMGKTNLIAALDELDVDLVLFGHNHAFLRSNPIKNKMTDSSQPGYFFQDKEGTIYYSAGCSGGSAGAGGGSDGAATSETKMARTYFSVMDYDAARGQLYAAITVTSESITVRTYALPDDKLVDEFIITHTHEYSSEVSKPTCTERGYTTYGCSCGDSYVADFVDALGHSYDDGTCTQCGELDPDYHIPGDINGDGELNNKDVTRLFRYLSCYDVDAVEASLDVNGDGDVNNKDLIRLFRYLSGWDVEIY